MTPRDPNSSAYGWSRDEGRRDFQFTVYCGRNSAKPRSRPSPTRTAVWPSQILQCDLWTAPETAPEINRAEKAPLDRTPTKRTPRIKTPQPTVDRPARACGICGEDITQRDPNTRKCRHCRHHRLPLTELRRSRARERKCSDCEAVISLRVHNALRCEECAPEHRTKQGQEIPGSPGEPGKAEQVPQEILRGEEEKPRQKGQSRYPKPERSGRREDPNPYRRPVQRANPQGAGANPMSSRTNDIDDYPDEPPRCPCRCVIHTPDLLLTYYARKVFLINPPLKKREWH